MKKIIALLFVLLLSIFFVSTISQSSARLLDGNDDIPVYLPPDPDPLP